VLWKHIENDFFLLVLKVLPVRHQLDKQICHNWTSCAELTLSSLIDSSVLGVVCFAHPWKCGLCLHAPCISLSEQIRSCWLDLDWLRIAILSLAHRAQFLVATTQQQNDSPLKETQCRLKMFNSAHFWHNSQLRSIKTWINDTIPRELFRWKVSKERWKRPSC